jgi:hypothetical protein
VLASTQLTDPLAPLWLDLRQRWSTWPARTRRAALAYAAFWARLERQVDPEGKLAMAVGREISRPAQCRQSTQARLALSLTKLSSRGSPQAGRISNTEVRAMAWIRLASCGTLRGYGNAEGLAILTEIAHGKW